MEVRTTHLNPIVMLQDWQCRTELVRESARAALIKRTNSMKLNPWMRPLKFLYRGLESTVASVGLADNLVYVLQKR